MRPDQPRHPLALRMLRRLDDRGKALAGRGDDLLPPAAMTRGYERNRDAAAAILDWLVAHTDIDTVMVSAVRDLLAA